MYSHTAKVLHYLFKKLFLSDFTICVYSSKLLKGHSSFQGLSQMINLTSGIPAHLSENIVTESVCCFVSKITVVNAC